MQHHGILNRGLGQNLIRTNSQLMQAQDSAAGAACRVEPDRLA